MKKILCTALAVMGVSVYALPWEEASNSLIQFFNGGQAVYIAENKNNLVVYPKHSIRRCEVDEDEVELVITKGDDEEKFSFKMNRYVVTLDNNKNLIITKK